MTGGSVVGRSRELPRKTLHLSTASVPLGLWLGVSQRSVAIGVVTLFGVACFVEWARRHSSAVAAFFGAAFGSMLRPSEVQRDITGATWLLAAFALTTLTAPLAVAVAATWAGAVGDSSAALVGRAWSRRRTGIGKTLVGSIACVVTTALGAWWLAGFSPGMSVALGVAAGAAERPAIHLDDNLRVTLAVAVVAVILGRI
jgi:dolichol kinase